MAVTDRIRDWTRTGTEQAKQRSRQGRLWLDLRRLDGRIKQEHAALGATIERLVESGLTLESPEARQHLDRLRELREQRSEKRTQADSV